MYTYITVVDGHSMATDSKAAVAWMFKVASTTMIVSVWDDATAGYVEVPQSEFSTWLL